MKTVLILAVPIVIAGCLPAQQFTRGLSDEGIRQGVDIAVTAAMDKYGNKIDGLGEKLGDVTEKIPPPSPSQESGTIWYGLGALAAYVIGSLGKGWIRDKMKKGDS